MTPMSSSDARKRLRESVDRLETRGGTHSIDPPRFSVLTHLFTQEDPMTKHDRHDELVALLTEIRDRLPKQKAKASFVERRPTTDGFNLRHWIMPGPHTFGIDCSCGPEKVPHEPAPADDLPGDHGPTLHALDDVAAEFGVDLDEPDALPGEPVEPGELRAGDRVEFAWDGGRFTCTLVSVRDGAILRSDTPATGGYHPPVVSGGEWDVGISDVRLIERAPREDEDPDEVQYEADQTLADVLKAHHEDRRDWVYTARAAREHIYAEPDQSWVTRDIEEAEGYYRVERARAEKAEAERDALRERLDALREGLPARVCESLDFLSTSLLGEAVIAAVSDVLARDDERAKGEQA